MASTSASPTQVVGPSRPLDVTVVCAHPGAAIRTAASTASAVNLGAYIHKLTNWKMTALQPT
ncbi:MAG: hypothetical protein OXF20_09485, partial [Gammaproteobacteria bacterium]|nr:hypothetical protein [Gammaproteobacteria bacterium]